MESREAATERILTLARGLDFTPRYYALVNATRDGEPCHDLPADEIRAALASTGRAFRYHRKERFYSTREADAPSELGLNLTFKGSVEFILVAQAPAGHVGDVFHGMALELAQRYAPELVPEPPYPRPWYRDGAELRRVLAGGLRLYADLAAEIRASGILDPSAAEDSR